jgi:hypothetical protein
LSWKVEDVADGRGTEGVDRLRIVADHGEAAAVRLKTEQDRGLKPVGVLIFVDQNVIKAPGDILGDLSRDNLDENGGNRVLKRQPVAKA